MTPNDITRLKEEIQLSTVIDLRNPRGQEKQREIDLQAKIGATYYNVSFRDGRTLSWEKELELYQVFSNMGEVYLYRIRQKEYGRRIVKALEIIADPGNHPLVFHCSVGKGPFGSPDRGTPGHSGHRG